MEGSIGVGGLVFQGDDWNLLGLSLGLLGSWSREDDGDTQENAISYSL